MDNVRQERRFDDLFVPAKHFKKPAGLYKYFPLPKKTGMLALLLAVGATGLAALFVFWYAKAPGDWLTLALAAAFLAFGIALGPVVLLINLRTRKKSDAVLSAILTMGKSLMSFDDIMLKARIVPSKHEFLSILARLCYVNALQTTFINVQKELLEKVR